MLQIGLGVTARGRSGYPEGCTAVRATGSQSRSGTKFDRSKQHYNYSYCTKVSAVGLAYTIH